MPSPRPFLRIIAAALLFCAADQAVMAQSTGTSSNTTTATTANPFSTQSVGGTTATDTSGPIAVFRLTFEQSGDSINYRPYGGGFYVAPVEGGPGSLILTLTTGAQKRYFTYASFGAVFVAVKGETKKMVLSATAASSVSTTVFYAIGIADHEIEFETRNSTGHALVASKMTGYAVSADSEQDLPFFSTNTSNVGVAGASILTVKLDDALTHSANNKSNAVSDEVTELQNMLIKAGFVDGKNTTATGAATTATSASTTNTTSGSSTTATTSGSTTTTGSGSGGTVGTAP